MAVTPDDNARRVIDHATTHFRVLGPPGSGKTRLLLERFRTLEARHAGRVFILTYSAENHRRLTDAVFERNTGRTGPPRVLTYSRLAGDVIQSAGARPPLIVTDMEEHLLLGEVIAGREAALRSDLRSICRSDRFVRELREACHVLRQNNVVGPRLRALQGAASSAELSDLLVLYDGFQRTLEERGAATHYDIAWKAVERAGPGRDGESGRLPLSDAAAVLIEDFQDIDPGQFALLGLLAPPGGEVALNVFGDPMGSVFAHRGTQHRFLMEEFPRLYGKETFYLPARRVDGGVPGETLEALLLETVRERASDYLPIETSAPPEAPSHDDALPGFRIEVVRDDVEEVYVVAARIARLLREGTLRPGEIAIVTNDKRRYEPLVAAAATQRGLPVDTGRSAKNVFVDFADALFALVDSPDDGVAARAILTSPLYREFRRAVPDADAPAGEDPTPPADALGGLVEDIRRAIASSEPPRWMEIIVTRCLRAVATAHAGATGEDSALRDVCRLLEAWERYVAAVERWGGRPGVGAFAALERSLPKVRAAVQRDAVEFLSCREVKGRFFPAVFVIGCSELLFPSAGRNENVLPMADLASALARACGGGIDVYRARSAGRRLEEEYHFLYVALTRATGALHVTSPGAFSGEDYPAPCAILERTVPDSLYTGMDPARRIPPQIGFAKAWVAATPARRADPRLEHLSPAGFQWRAPCLAAAPVRLAPFPLSKSTIETFLVCARRFFYRKALRLPETDSPPAKVGSLFHGVMADLGERFPTKAELFAGATPEFVRGIVAERVHGDAEIARTPFYERLFRHHLEKMVGKIIDLERGDPEDYTVRSVEETVTYRCGPWEFTGRIDRVHETAAGGRVIVDYKTGKTDKMAKTLRKKTLAALDDPGKANWQLPIYAWGVKTVDGRPPRAFTLMVTSPREGPFAVTLFILRDGEDIPPEARKGKGPSYLFESEIESVMARAAGVAERVFTPRSRFERTDDYSACRYCDFSRLCRREET